MKRITALLAALLSVFMLASCGQDIVGEAEQKGKSYFDSGDYETAAKAFGVAIDNGADSEETVLLYSICLNYYQAKQKFAEGDYDTALKIIEGIDEKYENYGIKETVLKLKDDISRAQDAKAKLADAEAKASAKDYAGATAILDAIDISKLTEDEVARVNTLKTSIADEAKSVETAKPVEQTKPTQPTKPVEQTKPTQPTKPVQPAKPVEKPVQVAPAINVNVGADAYIFPSDSTRITVEQLRTLSKKDAALIRNEIYARHGKIFKSAAYAQYFAGKTWYKATSEEVRWAELNAIERDNIKLISGYENGSIK